ncbi:MAG: BON domain-containing protein [Thermoanaerobaculia bacterium]
MDKNNKWSLVGSAGIGAGLGAGLMYLLDPQGGRGRRALARDKSVSALKNGGKAAAKTSRQLGNKSKELVSQAGSKLRQSDLVENGGALLEQVQRKVRRAVSHPTAIEAAVEEGRVILNGFILASELAGLLAVIEAIEEVTEVQNQLEIHELAADLAAFRSSGAKRWKGPATRVLTGGTGSALAYAGLKRKDPLGAALGAIGLGLLAHGLTNFDPKRLTRRLSRSKNGRALGAETLAELGQPESFEATHENTHENAFEPING